MLAGARAARAEEFPTPRGLESAVRFWVDVFTRYSRDEVVSRSLRPGRVYRVERAGDEARLAAHVRALEARLLLHGPRPVRAAAGADVPRVRAQRGLREAFAQALAAERLYRPIVERALAREGLPRELAALPLVESSYHPGAVSKAGAVGLWQLMPAVARRYLRVGGAGDERRDRCSSEAAARHLRTLRAALPSWPLALTAYNHGLAGVECARGAVGSDDLGVLVARHHGPGFGFASRNFYAEFLAALHVRRNLAQYFPDLAPGRLIEVRVKRGDTLFKLARRHGVSLASLRAANGLRSSTLWPGQRLLVRL
jgi:membrane-bound lytic murein transglycosylase D